MKYRSITRQAALRLVFSLGLFVVLVAVSTAHLYRIALAKAAHERAADLDGFYQSRLMQLEREWELQSRDFRVRIETTRFLEQPQTAVTNLQAFMTVQGANRRFQYLLIESKQGTPIFSFGTSLGLSAIPLSNEQENGWYRDPVSGDLYRVFTDKVWLGAAGMGKIAVFFRVDNALMQQLASPGISLTLLYHETAVASSKGQSGLDVAATDNPGAEKREIFWTGGQVDEPRLRIEAPVKVLFTTTELAVGVAIIPIVDALILWFTLGLWLMRNARRINELGGAVNEFSARQELSIELKQKIAHARGRQIDEIHEVADALEILAQQSVVREQERRLAAMVFASSSEAILITSAENRILAVNDAFIRLTGYQAEEVVGKSPKILSAGKESKEFYADMWDQISKNNHWSGEVIDRRKDGTIYPKWLNISTVRDESGIVTNYVGAFSDISERKEVEERFIHMATHDALTGLPNRQLLLDRLANAIKLCGRDGQLVGLMFLDLDNFKWVNDSLGHANGDILLVNVAHRLSVALRESDTVARLGGDEFVILIQNPASVEDLTAIAGKIIEFVAQPVELVGHTFQVTTSIGISVFPQDGDDHNTLLKHADTAMYAAKTAGRNQFRLYDASMNLNLIERIQMEQDLRLALTQGQLELYYQPKLNRLTGDIREAEALIRWHHPDRGLVSPAQFIPLAEENGLIIPMGEWIIRSACEQISRWQAAAVPIKKVAVNLSALQLESSTFVESVQRILDETGVSSSMIEFELTESMVLRNPEHSVQTLHELRSIGFTLALDDFGTGYSSLSYLKRLPVNTLKIDRSFVMGIPHERDSCQIVQMIIALAKSIGLDVVAEGIETELQKSFLEELGCDLLQGYLIAKPMTAQQYELMLEHRTKGNVPK